jgi:hypothetical protein
MKNKLKDYWYNIRIKNPMLVQTWIFLLDKLDNTLYNTYMYHDVINDLSKKDSGTGF